MATRVRYAVIIYYASTRVTLQKHSDNVLRDDGAVRRCRLRLHAALVSLLSSTLSLHGIRTASRHVERFDVLSGCVWTESIQVACHRQFIAMHNWVTYTVAV